MNDILLGALILFSGFVPVTIALWYSRKLLIEAQSLSKMAQGLSTSIPAKMVTISSDLKDEVIHEVNGDLQVLYKMMTDYLEGEEFTFHFKNVFNGMMGKQVAEVTKHMNEEGRLAGMPAPVKNVIAKGVGNFLEGYGVPKKTITDGILSLLNRPSRAQMEQQQDLIRQYAGLGPGEVFDVNGPKV